MPNKDLFCIENLFFIIPNENYLSKTRECSIILGYSPTWGAFCQTLHDLRKPSSASKNHLPLQTLLRLFKSSSTSANPDPCKPSSAWPLAAPVATSFAWPLATGLDVVVYCVGSDVEIIASVICFAEKFCVSSLFRGDVLFLFILCFDSLFFVLFFIFVSIFLFLFLFYYIILYFTYYCFFYILFYLYIFVLFYYLYIFVLFYFIYLILIWLRMLHYISICCLW